MTDKRLFLLDAMALVYRAYYALMRSPRFTSDGKNTNAQFGFTNTLIDLINKEKPSHMAVIWDTHAPTERHTEFEDYKANRQAAPEDLLASIPDIKALVTAFNIPCLESDGYEADDIIGGLAVEAAAEGYEVYMVTPDKDYGQLVSDRIFIYKPAYKGGSFEIMGPQEVCERWNIQSVSQVIDMLGLMGDAVDNIPGIPGVGEKTAAKLLAEYGTLENILEHAEGIKGALGQKIRDGKEKALLSKRLATIITDVPVKFKEADFVMKPWNTEALQTIFSELEFRTLGKRILERPEATPAKPVQMEMFPGSGSTLPAADLFTEMYNFSTVKDTEHQYHLIQTEGEIDTFLQAALAQPSITFDTETTSLQARSAKLVGISFSWKPYEAWYLPFPNEQQEAGKQLERLRPLFDKTDCLWIAHNVKYDLIILKNYGIELAGKTYDTMLAHYAFSPEGKRSMDLLSQQYLNYQPIAIEQLIGKKGKGQLNMRDLTLDVIKEYAAEDADITLQLKEKFDPLLDEGGVRALFEEVENPLAPVLADIEFEGVSLDTAFLNNYALLLEKDIEVAEASVYEQAGLRFNLASPRQLGDVLFERLKLDDKAKRTKTGQYATGEAVLQKFRHKHPIVEDILVFRELTKLKSTYVDALPQLIVPETGRLHTSFNQAVVASGRLSSTNPNLQNIPIRTDRGREIRKAFVASSPNHLLLSADYSQIELRVVAALSGDENMIQAFRENKDIHRATAARVYSVPEEEVTFEMRRNAKAVNFGIIYGQSAFGLSESLGISRAEAKMIIDNYFTQYYDVKRFMDDTVQLAKENGYVETLKGRRIRLKDINSSNATVRGFAERVAINAPIQGSAADMIKLAMIRIYERLKADRYKAKMILQVHDELLFDVPVGEVDAVKALVLEEMEHALPLPNAVPVIAEAGTGRNWLDAH